MTKKDDLYEARVKRVRDAVRSLTEPPIVPKRRVTYAVSGSERTLNLAKGAR